MSAIISSEFVCEVCGTVTEASEIVFALPVLRVFGLVVEFETIISSDSFSGIAMGIEFSDGELLVTPGVCSLTGCFISPYRFRK